MFVINLKRTFVILLLSISTFSLKAQKVHFVYLQTENWQPFYVKLNNKVLSSSPAGYIILPDLSSGDYQLIVGFPKNEFPEEDFKISIQNKNEGFLLKNFGEKGWSLFNMQSLALIPGSSSGNVAVRTKVQNDPFSTMLANVVKDSSLLQNNELPVSPKDTVVKSAKPVIALKDTALQKTGPEIATPEIKNVVQEKVQTAGQPITKLLSEKDQAGMQMVYVDKSDNNNDTVRIFIPAEKAQEQKPENTNALVEYKNTSIPSSVDPSQLTITPTIVKLDSDTITLVNDTIKVYKEREQKDHSKEVKISNSLKNPGLPAKETIVKEPPAIGETGKNQPSAKKDYEIIVLPKVITSSKVNSDCKVFATDGDFLKLRKKMAAENNNDEMIRIAKKVFRTRCFSTEQIKNLSFLFLTDEGKYMFFDAAYPFTSDSDQYNSLKSQLTDEYYINRFEAMIHK
ncbi:MAG: hypothetical protein Q8891_15945 [Bacteroidota bacterium]|nr:hypothetical protein [Bacteroidota bacterium]